MIGDEVLKTLKWIGGQKMENEKRTIEADALKNYIFWIADMHNTDYLFVDMVVDAIDNAPTVKVVHGHWVKYNFLGHDQFACSECQTLGSPQWKRCPVCEAKMDGERKDNG